MRDPARVGALVLAAARLPRAPSLSNLCLLLTLVGCSADPGTGSVEVTTASTGQGLDADGYLVEVEGAGTLAIGANAAATLAEVPAGDLEVRLTGVRGNCTVEAPHPRLIRVVAGETFRTQFDVVCDHTPLLGRLVFYSNRSGTYEIYSMNPDGSDVVQLTHMPEDERAFFPAVSPDGSRIAFVNRIGPEDDFFSGYLYVMNADGTDPLQLLPGDGGNAGPPAWSPDGSQIAFGDLASDQGGYDIWVVDVDGGGLRNLTNTPDDSDSHPSWSPDGRILFTAEGHTRIDIMSADGTARAPLPVGSGAHWAAWSPDGSRIAFISGSRLSTMNADGSNSLPLTPDDGGFDLTASWSPAGDRLAYIHAVDPGIEIYVINADGTGALSVTDNDTFEYLGHQAWGP